LSNARGTGLAAILHPGVHRLTWLTFSATIRRGTTTDEALSFDLDRLQYVGRGWPLL